MLLGHSSLVPHLQIYFMLTGIQLLTTYTYKLGLNNKKIRYPCIIHIYVYTSCTLQNYIGTLHFIRVLSLTP